MFPACSHFLIISLNAICTSLFCLLPNNKIKNCFKSKAFEEDELGSNGEIIVGIGENVGNKHFLLFLQCFLPAFSPFPTVSTKAFFLDVLKHRIEC